MKDLVIIGAGGFGREVAWLVDDINEVNKEWNLLGFIDDNEENHGNELNGYKILGGFKYLNNKDNIYYVCAVGNAKTRKKIVEEKCSQYNIKPATLIHPSVIMSKEYNEIGEGCIICAGSIITVNARISNHIIINLDCTIGHDVVMNDYITVYPSVNISGNCNIGETSEIGTGTQIIQGKSIGDSTIIGAGSVVVKNIEGNCTAVGVPAKIIKSNNKEKLITNKKVLYITTVSRTVNAFLIPHIEMLLENGYSVDIACSIDKEIDKGLIEKGVRVFEVPFSRSPLSIGNFKAFKELIKIQKENQYGIVHVHTPIASIFGRLLKVKFPKLKTIYTAHGYHFLKGGSKAGWLLYYPIEKVMAKFTDVTININSEDYEITKSKLKPKKSYLVKGVGLDLNSYKTLSYEEQKRKKQELNIKDEDFVVIMIAELNENKNQIQLIKAIELLKEDCPRLKVMFVGEGDKLNELKQEALARGVRDKVLFLGFRNDVNELINISDIGTLLSYREGLPRNIMELMANGKKVIATDIRGCRDLVCNENVGQLVKVGDFQATARAIKEYYYMKEIMLEVAATYESSDEEIVREIEPYDVVNVNKELMDIYKSLN